MSDKKFIIVVPDGAADLPLEELGGKTPLMAANTPNMDFIAKNGICGTALTVPEGMEPGSDVANCSLLGYDPRKNLTGRGALEAASLEISLKNDEVAFRCNLITVEDDRLIDYCADHITSEESKVLMAELSASFDSPVFKFFSGKSYRNIIVANDSFADLKCRPPHDIVGESYSDNLPKGRCSDEISSMMEMAGKILEKHPVNISRIKNGKRPANAVWPWGQGKIPRFASLNERFAINGAVISAVDLVKGLGILAGMKIINVPGATGYYDTDYQGKALYAIKALYGSDLVYIHVEAPDEAGHAGSIEQKIAAIENIDDKILGTLLNEVSHITEDFCILIAPDHPTPISIRTHTAEPVPFAYYYLEVEPDGGTAFNEKDVLGGTHEGLEAWKLMDMIVEKLINK